MHGKGFGLSQRVFVSILLLLAGTVALGREEASPLAESGSPYLRLHADDPVAWREWDASAIEEARASNRLIFVSIGYYACHWCHVMQRESFQDEDVAAYLNEHFVPVKVDREVDTVLDDQMMLFMEVTRGQGGWPLNVFLTPDGYPLVGVLYLPRDDFLGFLRRLQPRWQQDAAALAKSAQDGWEALYDAPIMNKVLASPYGTAVLRQGFLDQVTGQADELSGGFGSQSKFPQTPQLRAALMLQSQHPDPQLEAFLRLTLNAMADAGLRDHVGGGFFRYTVDPQWQIPHFEKMLYDNAQLARLYLEAARVLDEPRYREVGLDTLRFMREIMQSRHGGGYISSLSAIDDNDVEGGHYLWTLDAIREAAGEDWRLIELAWGLNLPPGLDAGYLPFLHGTIPSLAGQLGVSEQRLREALDRTERALLERRKTRGLPRDEKRLASWNGLALSALAHGAVAGDREAEAAAGALAKWMRATLWRQDGLIRGVDARDDSLGDGVLADYALVAEGLVVWARHSGDAAAWHLARDLVDVAWTRFRLEDGRWLADPGSLLPGQLAMRMAPDDVLPSSTATLLLASEAVGRHFGDEALLRRVAEARASHIEALKRVPFYHATFVTRVLGEDGGKVTP